MPICFPRRVLATTASQRHWDRIYLGAPDSTGTTQITVLGKVVSSLGTGIAEVRLTDTTVLGSVTHGSSAAAGDDLFVVEDSFIQGTSSLTMSGVAQAYVYINDSSLIGALTIVTGGGSDFVGFDTDPNRSSIKCSFCGAVVVNLGLGDDIWASGADPSVANLGSYFDTSVKIDGGGGTDEVQFIYATGGNGSNIFATSSPVLFSVERVF